jgi:peptidoglycan/xylan/chitin deacetylase (PgdA/CDA1 family)
MKSKLKVLLAVLLACACLAYPITALAMSVHRIGAGMVTGPTTAGGNYNKNEKVMYLTFDDGPGPYTDRLLDILKKNDAKATFFVTNGYPKYRSCIAREAREGHAVGVHSYTHDYKYIYASQKNYWDDYKKMDDIILQEIGDRASLMRFPGGSSNTVSRHYSKGIMSRLAADTKKKGIVYVDWNAMAGDAGEVKTADGVYNYIRKTTGKQKQVIVLCHDIKPYTVDAMDKVIKWAKSQGYSLRALTPGGFNVHQKIAN